MSSYYEELNPITQIASICEQYKPQVEMVAHCLSLLADNGNGGLNVLENVCNVARAREIGNCSSVGITSLFEGNDLIEDTPVGETNQKRRDRKKYQLGLLQRMGLIRKLSADERYSILDKNNKQLDDIFTLDMKVLGTITAIFEELGNITDPQFWDSIQQLVTKGRSEDSNPTHLKVDHKKICKALNFLLVFNEFPTEISINKLSGLTFFGRSPSHGKSTTASDLAKLGVFTKQVHTREFIPNNPLSRYCIPLICAQYSSSDVTRLGLHLYNLQSHINSVRKFLSTEF